MHEYSIAQDLLAQCEGIARLNGAKSVELVIVKIGVLSGVEAHYLKQAFDVLKLGSICDKAILKLEEQELIYSCSCGVRAPLKEQVFRCHICDNKDIKIESGEELILQSLELET